MARQSTSIATFFTHTTSYQTHFDPNSNSFEFNESDLYINDSSSLQIQKAPKVGGTRRRMTGSTKLVGEESRSVPVSIPQWRGRVMQWESEGSDDEDEGESRVPPHEYLARRRGASLSVHEGVGRTLKGRDMSRVRNAVWKRIGFED